MRELETLREENERLKRDTTELLKLRNEVAMLRQKTDASAKARSTPSGEVKPATLFESDESQPSSDRSTADGASKSFMSAIQGRNFDEMIAYVVAENSGPVPYDVLRRFFSAHSSNPRSGLFSGLIGLTATSLDKTNPTEAHASAVIQSSATFRKVGAEWKLVVFSSRDANGNISYVGLEKPSA